MCAAVCLHLRCRMLSKSAVRLLLTCSTCAVFILCSMSTIAASVSPLPPHHRHRHRHRCCCWRRRRPAGRVEVHQTRSERQCWRRRPQRLYARRTAQCLEVNPPPREGAAAASFGFRCRNLGLPSTPSSSSTSSSSSSVSPSDSSLPPSHGFRQLAAAAVLKPPHFCSSTCR